MSSPGTPNEYDPGRGSSLGVTGEVVLPVIAGLVVLAILVTLAVMW